jgi:membrane-associated phospholipid phosphatase
MLFAGSIVAGSRVALGYHTVEQVSLSVFISIPFTWFVIYILPTMLPALF